MSLDPRADPLCPHCRGYGTIVREHLFEGEMWSFMEDCYCISKSMTSLDERTKKYVNYMLRELSR